MISTRAIEKPSEHRSWVMSRVKARDTGPELIVRRMLHAKGYRYRLHRADLPGKPDIVFSSSCKVIFVHGCFWHGHDCARGARVPVANGSYWTAKIGRNRARDANHLADLTALGWRALVVWECELRDLARVKARILRFLRHTGRKNTRNGKRTLDLVRNMAPKRRHAGPPSQRIP
jgi:DNA mismatch endonuclease (patch repair protein)